jgi:aspartate kinase
MTLIVQKYGGSSVADPESILNVARKILETYLKGNKVVAVVSAMGDTTDDLIALTAKLSSTPPKREFDQLLATGEIVSISALAIAISELGKDHGIEGLSFRGEQAGISTNDDFNEAKIMKVAPKGVIEALNYGYIPIVAGFQGYNSHTHSITTLGRSGSDTTAVALAAGLNADICEIYSDVDGVFSADPRIVKKARKFNTITYDEMIEMAASGSKVLATRAVEYAKKNDLIIHARSTFSNYTGTIIAPPKTDLTKIPNIGEKMENIDHKQIESPLLYAVSNDDSVSEITLSSVEDKPGIVTTLFKAISNVGVVIDTIVQNVSTADDKGKKYTDVSMTVKTENVDNALKAIDSVKSEIGFKTVEVDNDIAKVSLTGASIKNAPGIFAGVFEALSEKGINIDMITTSEIRITVVIKKSDMKAAVQAIHTKFGLDSNSEATVYAGTGI